MNRTFLGIVVRDYPTQQKAFPWKIVLISAGGVVVAAGILFGVLFFVGRNATPATQAPSSAKTFQQVQEETNADPCAGVEDVEVCQSAQKAKQVVADKNPDACETLDESVKDDCFWSIARALNDESICEKMTQKNFAAICAAQIIAPKALAASDASLCDKITDVRAKETCVSVVSSSVSMSQSQRHQPLS